MPDWERYVRDRLRIRDVLPERQQRMVRELASNLEDIYGEARADGASEQDAEAAARRHVEDWDQLASDLRRADPSALQPRLDKLRDTLDSAHAAARGPRRLAAGLPRDVLHGIRRLRSQPGFTSVAVIVLALGIGANAAMFNVVDTFLYRPLPYPNPEELVRVFETDEDERAGTCSYPTYVDLASLRGVFTAAAPVILGQSASWVDASGSPREVAVSFVGSAYFPVTGLALAMGRSFTETEDRQGGPAAAVISHRLWVSALGADPAVLGKVARFSGAAVTIVGVGPRGYGGMIPGHSVDFWLSFSALGPVWGEYAGGTLERRGDHWFDVLGRLSPGIGRAQAQAGVANLASRLAADFPEYHRGRNLVVYDASSVRLKPETDTSIRPAGVVLMAISGLVLLVACTNLASLVLARGWRRRREIGIRQAVGATRWDLVRQLLVESLLLGLAGGAAGVLVAWWSGRVITAQAAALSLPLNVTLGVDFRVLVFAFLLSLAAGLAFGTAPALRVTNPALAASLSNPETTVQGSMTARRRRVGLRGIFIIAQVGASMVLLVAAGLLVRAVQEAQGVNLGAAAAARIAFVQADAGQAGYDEARAGSLFRELADRVRGLPGVESVSWANRLPVTVGSSSTLVIDEVKQRTGAETVEVELAWVGHGYFETLRIPLLHGRVFTEQDEVARRRLAVVSLAMAERYWGRADVVGETYLHQGGTTPVEIVGVVGNVKVETPGESPTPIFYYPLAPGDFGRLAIVARGTGQPDTLAAAMRAVLRELDGTVPVVEAGTMADHVARSLSLQRAAAGALGLFGALALLLAAIGLYGVVAATVTERTSEVGIRMALGAAPRDIVAMLVREVMLLVAIGGAIGLVAAALMAPALRSLVLGLARTDAPTMAVVTALLAAVALVASWLPARRAVSGGTLAAIKQR